jgi:hypothetical protein
MARVLKNNRSIINPFDGSINSTAYLVVDDLGLNKQRKQIRFDVVVYAHKQARIDGRKPLSDIGGTIVVNDPEFSLYFSPAANSKIWQQIYDYLDIVVIPGIVAADWKKDPDEEV